MKGVEMLNGKIISECIFAESVYIVRRPNIRLPTGRKPDSLHGHFRGRLQANDGLASKHKRYTYQERMSERREIRCCDGSFLNETTDSHRWNVRNNTHVRP